MKEHVANSLVVKSESKAVSTLMKHVRDTNIVGLFRLCHRYLHIIFPHCLRKVNSVTHGLIRRDQTLTPLNGYVESSTRRYMSVPYVGKDQPSNASEYSHPDILIMLTLLAYRHGGLRKNDVRELVLLLQEKLRNQKGAVRERPSFQLFDRILSSSNAMHVLPLHIIQIADGSNLEELWSSIQFNPLAIYTFLETRVYPECLNHRSMKLSASGEELVTLFKVTIGKSYMKESRMKLNEQLNRYQWYA